MIDMCPISLEAAGRLIDFSGRGKTAALFADLQLQGTVAIHNLLADEGFAYLADEVGMGKTYVALGVVGLLRHVHPNIRVLVIAPRRNIQLKWIKELKNFTANNWRVTDLRVRSFQGQPAVGHATCERLLDFARHSVNDANRDYFARMTSFSFGLRNDIEYWDKAREDLQRYVPWLDKDSLPMDSKRSFKDAYARAVNTTLPHFDLLILDEGHNLKRGLGEHVAARNRLLSLVLGRPGDPGCFKQEAPRVDRVLVLSATPVEADYRELWNQMDVLAKGDLAPGLKDNDLPPKTRRDLARRFLVRRLTAFPIEGEHLTKNQYRREWRAGGVSHVSAHDQALPRVDDKQRLVVALIQKKVAEVLASREDRRGHRFGRSFQMGMLASFESFLQTSRARDRVADEDVDEGHETAFDQSDQAEDATEREGIDTSAVNTIAASHLERFGVPLPHPKMDAVATSLARDMLEHGEKTLVFVRRIASVDELAEKVLRAYDAWLYDYLRRGMNASAVNDLDAAIARYETQHRSGKPESPEEVREDDNDTRSRSERAPHPSDDDRGGIDSFFAWFFRGADTGSGILSGAAFRKNRLASEGSRYSTLFEDNYVRRLLDWPSSPVEELSRVSGMAFEDVARRLRQDAITIFRRDSKQQKSQRRRAFLAYQEAAIRMMESCEDLPAKALKRVRIVRSECFSLPMPARGRTDAPDAFPDPEEPLAAATFFTTLSLPQFRELRDDIWPEPDATLPPREAFREQERRRELASSAITLGHPMIDLWKLAVGRLSGLQLGQHDEKEERSFDLGPNFVALLDEQRKAQLAGERGWSAYKELAALGREYHLLADVNFPTIRDVPVRELGTFFQRTLGRQTPVAGMHGKVNETQVRQFRMPGYPYVLISTDVLQEGEDLHTFCSRVVHYGIAWTPSAMEQRTGRIDRIGSLVHRRLPVASKAMGRPDEEAFIQVFTPYLEESIELVQVREIHRRMNGFLEMLHDVIGQEGVTASDIDVSRAMVSDVAYVPAIRSAIKSAFDIDPLLLKGAGISPTGDAERAKALLEAFHERVKGACVTYDIDWEKAYTHDLLRGTCYVNGRTIASDIAPREDARQQPFLVYLRSAVRGGVAIMRVLSPIGVLNMREGDPAGTIAKIHEVQRRTPEAKICAGEESRTGKIWLTAETDITFDLDQTQPEEIRAAFRHAVLAADLLEEMVFDEDKPFDEVREALKQRGGRG